VEATWRILNFPIVGNKPAIILLPVHLEGHQIVSYNPNIPGDAERALQAHTQTNLAADVKQILSIQIKPKMYFIVISEKNLPGIPMVTSGNQDKEYLCHQKQ